MMRKNISSGTQWESRVGYSRAVRTGNHIEVSGTVAADASGVLAPGDAYGQTVIILDRIEQALVEAGSGMQDVVRTRIFVTDISGWEAVGRAHAEKFGDIRPAATMVEVRALIRPGLLVEIEATAVAGSSDR